MGYRFCYTCSHKGLRKSRLPSLEQTTIHQENDGRLVLRKPSTKALVVECADDVGTGKQLITTIPRELLSEILKLAIAEHFAHRPWYENPYSPALALSRVCKKFHSIVQPLLFRNIEITYCHSIMPACKPAIFLHREVKANRALGEMCRSLQTFIAGCTMAWHPQHETTSEDFALGVELLSWLPNVTSFNLQAQYDHPLIWPIIVNSIRNMPNVRDLTLSRQSSNLFMAPVGDLVQTLQLNTLVLYGISAQENQGIWSPKKEYERTSPISKLELSAFGETPQALHNLLKLPKGLKEFRFVHCNDRGWTLNSFDWLLADHRSTLEILEINSISRDNQRISLLNFPRLKTLTMSHWIIDFSPEAACSMLLAPSLRRFIWDFTIHDQHSESWSDFGPSQRDWITKFGELAAARRSALREIQIIFTPDEGDLLWIRDECLAAAFPWELMDEAKAALLPHGIELTYNEGFTRKSVEDRIEEYERREQLLLEEEEREGPEDDSETGEDAD